MDPAKVTANLRMTPTLINLPPPPSDPVTPSDVGPGTPNSTTTSLSALSTVAIKDGHQGQHHPRSRHAHQSSSASMSAATALDAERADRISRLAGLERVATAHAADQPQPNFITPAAYASGYFDIHPIMKERSTVGSASATGSVGGRMTWASGSDAFEADKMSEGPEPDDGISSVGNVSDEGDTSLVGFGEGASTISGPISSHPAAHRLSGGGALSALSSPAMSRANHIPPYRLSQTTDDSPVLPPSPPRAGSDTPEPSTDGDARMVDGMTYDPDVVDTTVRTPRLATPYDRSPIRGDVQALGDGSEHSRHDP